MLPPVQKKVFQFVLVHLVARGYPPTYEQIADAFGWSSKNAAWGHVNRLTVKGMLEQRKANRAITVPGTKLTHVAGLRTLLFLPTPAGERAHREFLGGAA